MNDSFFTVLLIVFHVNMIFVKKILLLLLLFIVLSSSAFAVKGFDVTASVGLDS